MSCACGRGLPGARPDPGICLCRGKVKSHCKCSHEKDDQELAVVAEELDGVPGAEASRVELANIRRLAERHGIAPADGNGIMRSTVAMVEELALRRPPR